nr:HNH endonuclease [Burkholderia contaminans]
MKSPDVTKWLEKGGAVHVEVESGTWVYTNAKGTVVRYPSGYPDFKPYEVRSVDVEGLKGNHSRAPAGDFGLADAKAGSPADYTKNTWHHHENMVTMQEIPKDIHSEFTHRGRVSNLKNQSSC